MLEEINALRNDLDMTIRTLYSLKRFNEYLGREEGVTLINKNTNFWRIYHYSIVTNLLIGTRRIFDKGPDAKTLSKLINRCKQDDSLFASEAFEERKMQGLQDRPIWLDSYLLSHAALTKADFKGFAKLINAHCKPLQADNDYYVISNQIIAHPIHIVDYKFIDSERSKIDLSKVEKGLLALLFVLDNIHMNYTMGRILHEGREIFGYAHENEIYEALDKQLVSFQ